MKSKLQYTAFLVYVILTHPLVVCASNGETYWNLSLMLVTTWIPRLGAMMLFGGVIEYAIAYQSDNANQKTQGIRLMVAGGMVMGIPVAIGSLIKI